MNEDRTVLTDAMWARTCPMLPGKETDPGAARQWAGSFSRQCSGASAPDRPGATFRSISARRRIFKRFRRWAVSGVFEQVFNELPDEFDLEHVFAGGTIVQAHRKAAGARGDLEAGYRTLPGRPDRQDRGGGECP